MCLLYNSHGQSRPKPTIKFLGLFDTVKVVNDDTHNLTFLDSIFHVRHALAMNESRRYFPLTPFHPLKDPQTFEDRSIIEAWFVGTHSDIGGGATDDGLSLYPLQWMCVEAKKIGLMLDHDPREPARGLIEDPLKLIYPTVKAADGIIEATPPWKFKFKNGIEVQMYDLRQSHNHGNLQTLSTNRLTKTQKPKKSRKSNNSLSCFGKCSKPPKNDTQPQDAAVRRHVVRISATTGNVIFKSPRAVFEPKRSGALMGYFESSTIFSSSCIHGD
jgi:uncharacterized protein (DUF2235 family)